MVRFKSLFSVVALLALFAVVTFSAGCGSSGETVDSDASADASEEEYTEYAPQEGMTKDEIAQMYGGQPDQKTVNSDGSETWRYHVNAGAAWIPYNFGYRPQYHVIHFNTEGRVRAYSLNE